MSDRRHRTGDDRAEWRHALLLALALAMPVRSGVPAPREFPVGRLERIDELPAGRFRDQLERLPAAARDRARQWLRSFHFTEHDARSLHADGAGGICFACRFERPEPVAPSETDDGAGSPAVALAETPVGPFPTNLIFHSRRGAPNVLYINFTGETVVNTAWNDTLGRAEIPAVAFSIDTNLSTFSDAEQVAIKRIWQRMAEDYAPFNIDVTTERPAAFNNRTAMALVTRRTDANGAPNPFDTAGGVAYVNVFGTTAYATYRPAWVYHDNLGNVESYIAEAASHEVGHNLGLSHDGTSSLEYYGGHGSGDISWGPIMGTGYNRNVSQWSKGEYADANNMQDDLATIAGKISYRVDDHGNTAGTATALVLADGTNIVHTTPEDDPANTNAANKGVLDRNTDADVFSFVTASGMVRLAVNPWISPAGTRGGNLDALLELRDEAGALVATNNPADRTTALIETTLAEGRYYLHVKASGAGAPLASPPTGYTAYASLGQYFIGGYVTPGAVFVVPPLAELQVSDLTQSGQASKAMAVTYSDDVAINVATIDSSDLRVTGPNGYDQAASLVSVDLAGNGSPRTATYAVAPPGGGVWSPVHNGTYEVWMRTNQVADVEGVHVAAGRLGTFQVAVPVSVYAAGMDSDPGWTLEPQWQYGAPAYAAGTGPTGGYTGTKIVGYNLSGNYASRLGVKYATTPPVDCTGKTSLTLRFKRWLVTRSSDIASIQVSTNGADWIDVWSSSGAVSDGGWQEVQHALPAAVSGSPSLRVRWGQASNRDALVAIGWNLDDVEILAGGALDAEPPAAALGVANLTMGGSPSHSCNVTFTDETAVRLSSLDGTDLLVTGPNGYSNLVEFIGADLPGDGSPLTGSYAIPASGGVWDEADNGVYTVTLQDGAVSDTLNNATPETALGTFEVAIVAVPGQLGISPAGGLASAGREGGPFSPDSIVYTLTNSGGAALAWTAGGAQPWVDVSVTGGVLAAGASTALTVSIGTNANALAAGAYEDTVSFVNATSGNGSAARAVSLAVEAPPVFELVVTVNPPAWGSVSPTGGSYTAGAVVNLLAAPADYYRFDGWGGDAAGTDNPLALTMDTNRSVLASFSEIVTTNHPTPYWWLAQYGYTNDPETEVSLPGANGYALWQSYIAGLNPNDPDSRLLLDLDLVPGGAETTLRWNTVSGRVYDVWFGTNLLQGFSPLPGATNLPWTVQGVTNAAAPADPAAFYRVDVRKP